MAPTKDPQPDHPAIKGLDKAFTNAPALAGYLEYLSHPEQNYGPRMVDETGAESNAWPTVSPPSHNPPYIGPVLRDLTIPQFFAAADILSGQDIDAMGRAVTAVEAMRFRRDGDVGPYRDSADMFVELTTAVNNVVDNWNTQAGQDFKQNVQAEITIWYNHRVEKLYVMSKRLVEFGAVIATARKNLNDLMATLVDTLDKHTNDDEGRQAVLYFLGKILGFAIGKVDPLKGGSPLIFTELYAKALEAAKPDTTAPSLNAETYYQILHNYLREARSVCEEASAAVHQMVTTEDFDYKSLAGLRTGMPKPPAFRS